MSRQGLGKEVLRRTLLEAKALGINEVLICCDKDHFASSRVMLANGAVFSEAEYVEEIEGVIERYWVKF